MNKLTDLQKAENKLLKAYIDYYMARYSDLPDSDDISMIEARTATLFFTNSIMADRDRREKFLTEYVAKLKAKEIESNG